MDIDFDNLLKLYNSDYIVQDIVSQHKTLADIHLNP